MTEDQKAISVVLEVLAASKGVPRTRGWIGDELRMAGRRTDTSSLLDRMVRDGLVEREDDALGLARYTITREGKEALDVL